MAFTRSDAWLFAALGFGHGDPVKALSAAELGQRGLIVPHDQLPVLTELGHSHFDRLSKLVIPRQLPQRLLIDIVGLPSIAGAVLPLDAITMRDATAEIERRLEQFSQTMRTSPVGECLRSTDEEAG